MLKMNSVAVALALLVLSGCAVGSLAAQATVSFQNDVNGYQGCKSTDISTLYDIGAPGQWNDNGATFADGDNDWCIGLLKTRSDYGYDISPLFRFDDIHKTIPAGSTILEANLTVLLPRADRNGARLEGRYVKATWYGDDFTSGSPNRCGWRYRDKSNLTEWSVLGALGEGTDLIPDKKFYLPTNGGTFTVDVEYRETVTLDRVVVQSWLDNPATNNGIKFQADVANVHVSITQCQRKVSTTPPRSYSDRPKLTITYTSDAVTFPPSNPASSGSSVTNDARMIGGSGLGLFVAIALFALTM